jgi:hypothetical protein
MERERAKSRREALPRDGIEKISLLYWQDQKPLRDRMGLGIRRGARHGEPIGL